MFKKLLDWIKSLFWNKNLELAIVGLQNAGKSTFVNSLGTGKFEDTIPTIGFNHRQFKKGNVCLQLWDVGGQPRFRESWEKYCRDADAIIFVVYNFQNIYLINAIKRDSADYSNLDIAKNQLHQLLSYPSLETIPLLVLGNKNDLKGCLDEEELIIQLDLKSIQKRTVACYSVSAKCQTNIDITLKWLSNLQKRKK